LHQFSIGTKSLSINFPKGIKMLNTKKIAKSIDADKNKLNAIKSVVKKKIQSKLNQKTEFHRSLEAFSDCV
jgi:hypothetical protein|tara:strand:+ start:12543 stop:12755 length:213 start_codon:yes stop_codon:yes gene_type:complete